MAEQQDVVDEYGQKIIQHARAIDAFRISVTAGRVRIAIGTAWLETPCEQIGDLITALEVARDAAALMKSSSSQRL